VPLTLIGYDFWRHRIRPPIELGGPVNPSPVQPSPVPDLTAVRQAVSAVDCADLDFNIGPNNEVLLSGFTKSEKDRAGVKDRLLAVAHVRDVQLDGVEIEPYPYCEVLRITKPLRERNQREHIGLNLNVKGGDVLYEGNDFAVEIQTPDYPPYLYLDYVQQDGTIGHVAHAHPNSEPDSANDQFQLPVKYEISEPFGREMVVLISSPEPLFLSPRPDEFERAQDYLPLLRRRIEELQAARQDLPLVAMHVDITTKPASARP
jgi:hypothetical protein